MLEICFKFTWGLLKLCLQIQIRNKKYASTWSPNEVGLKSAWSFCEACLKFLWSLAEVYLKFASSMHEVPWSLDKVFSCEEAALEIQMSLCLSIHLSVFLCVTKLKIYRHYKWKECCIGDIHFKWEESTVQGIYITSEKRREVWMMNKWTHGNLQLLSSCQSQKLKHRYRICWITWYKTYKEKIPGRHSQYSLM